MQRRHMRAGGSIVALGTIAGTIIGAVLGQPSAGILVGFACGALAATLVWLADRKRS